MLNPDKGWIATNNNRFSSFNSKTMIGTTLPTTARAVRIHKLLNNLVQTKSGQVEYQDFKDIMQDEVDEYAIHKKKNMISIVKKKIISNPQH